VTGVEVIMDGLKGPEGAIVSTRQANGEELFN
jgi:hypothetical protein